MSQISNLEHERAKEAWSCVDYVNTEDEYDKKFKTEYRSLVMKLPTLIITNGLGQTLAFLKCKGKSDEKKPKEKPEARVYKDLEGWLDNRIQWNARGELIEKVISLPSDKFRFATAESLAYLSWMKRFADAVLPKEGD
jgi:CRISPR-associated protein Cmr5